MAKLGRPPMELDEETIKKLASIQCTQEEIAYIMGCSVDTIHNRFSDIIKEAQAHGKMSLRRHMWKKVQDGNVTMMIWLSKQYLGMSEKKEITHDTQDSKLVINLTPWQEEPKDSKENKK